MTVTQASSCSSASLSLPRILCLHGGGVNARVFEMQCRSIISRLRPFFRLVFVDGPYIGPPHPDIVSVYGHLGPFRNWLQSPIPQHHGDDNIVGRYLRSAMDADLGSGEWVGVLGFSQGAKIAASLLWAQEEAARRSEWPLTTFKFGIIMAGSPPIVRLTPQKPLASYSRSIGLGDVLSGDLDQEKRIVNTPTVHVHGLQDPGLDNHRMLLKRSFKSETTHLVEWNGGHRLPIKTKDVFAIIDAFVAAVKNIETIRDMSINKTKPVIEI